jgi:hypothetical protein
MNEDDMRLLEGISSKLDVLISLALKNAPEGLDEKRRQGTGEMARYLSGFGLSAANIAKIVGAPLGSVRTLLTPSRKK